jgi:hypothetical protein
MATRTCDLFNRMLKQVNQFYRSLCYYELHLALGGAVKLTEQRLSLLEHKQKLWRDV